MTNRLNCGDYLPDGAGGFVRLTGTAALLGRCLFRLQCRRGALPLLPELGSRLYALGREQPSARQVLARQYCVQALAPEPVRVTDAAVAQGADGALRVTVYLDCGGEAQSVEVSAG